MPSRAALPACQGMQVRGGQLPLSCRDGLLHRLVALGIEGCWPAELQGNTAPLLLPLFFLPVADMAKQLRPLLLLPGPRAEAVLSVNFSPDGRQLASGSGDSTVRFWDLRTQVDYGDVVMPYHAQVHAGAIQRGGPQQPRQATTCCRCMTGFVVLACHMQTPKHTCKGHRSWVLVVAWSPDAAIVASGGVQDRSFPPPELPSNLCSWDGCCVQYMLAPAARTTPMRLSAWFLATLQVTTAVAFGCGIRRPASRWDSARCAARHA